jgi:hypothetical protein
MYAVFHRNVPLFGELATPGATFWEIEWPEFCAISFKRMKEELASIDTSIVHDVISKTLLIIAIRSCFALGNGSLLASPAVLFAALDSEKWMVF